MNGTDGQFDGVTVAAVAVRPDADRDTVSGLLRQMEEICRPSPAKVAVAALATLRALTVHRNRGDVDGEVMAEAYARRLAEYPPDVIVAACDAWADREQFWPSWAELKAECDRRMRGRVQIRDALAAAL